MRTPVLRLSLHALELVLRSVSQNVARAVTGHRDDEEITQPLEEVLDEAARIVAGLDHALDDAEGRGAVTARESIDGLIEQRGVRVPQQRHRRLVADLAVDRTGHQLVEHRQGVTHRAAARAHDEGQNPLAHADVLLGAQGRQVRAEDIRGHQAERVVVGARADRADDALGFRRRENKLDVLGRLLDELEQRIEALVCDHVGLVDDEDLVAVTHRREGGALAQVTRIVDAAVRGRVDLDNIERAGAAGGQLAAGFALAARGVRGALRAVQAAREDARRRGLAASARPGEQVRVRDAIRAQRRLERLRHVFLADHLVKGVGAIPAIQSCGHPPSLVAPTLICVPRRAFHTRCRSFVHRRGRGSIFGVEARMTERGSGRDHREEEAARGHCCTRTPATGVSEMTRREGAATMAAPATPTRARNGCSRNIDYSSIDSCILITRPSPPSSHSVRDNRHRGMDATTTK